MFQKTTAIAAWACLAFIVFATISPIQFRPSLPTSPTFEHLAAFAVFAVLLTFAYPRSTAMVCLVVVGSAILLEAIQMLTPDRDARALDAIQKIVGGMLGIIVVNVTRSRRGRSPDRDPTPEEQGKDPAAVALGKKGGKARADSMTAEKRAEIAKKAAKPF